MGSFISKQPNGLLCRFSIVVDCPTHWNMSIEDYKNLRAEWAREEAEDTVENHLKPFDWVKEYFRPYNMTQEEFDKFLKDTSTPIEDLVDTMAKPLKPAIWVDSLIDKLDELESVASVWANEGHKDHRDGMVFIIKHIRDFISNDNNITSKIHKEDD